MKRNLLRTSWIQCSDYGTTLIGGVGLIPFAGAVSDWSGTDGTLAIGEVVKTNIFILFLLLQKTFKVFKVNKKKQAGCGQLFNCALKCK